MEHTQDDIPQLSPQKVASSGAGGPGALQNRLEKEKFIQYSIFKDLKSQT